MIDFNEQFGTDEPAIEPIKQFYTPEELALLENEFHQCGGFDEDIYLDALRHNLHRLQSSQRYINSQVQVVESRIATALEFLGLSEVDNE